jgi:hypothetical protein
MTLPILAVKANTQTNPPERMAKAGIHSLLKEIRL